MSLELRVGQLLCCNREHFGLGSRGIVVINVGDLLLVIDVISCFQGRATRLDDGAEVSILTIEEIEVNDAGCVVVGSETLHYVEVSL